MPPYSLFALIGGFLSFAITLRKNSPLSRYDNLYCCIMGLIGAAAGGKLLYILLNLSQVIKTFSLFGLQTVLEGGFVFYGGLFGSIIAIYQVSKTNHLNFQTTLNYLAPSFAIFIFAGRLGCFFSGCCYGRTIGTFQFPTQLTEASFGLLLCLLLLLRKTLEGQFNLFLLSYAIFRFLIEFLRGDPERGFFWLLSTSQWISLFILLALAIFKPKKE